MNRLHILDAHDASDRAAWCDLWTAWPRREVFAHPGYVSLYANQNARALAATWQSEGVNVLYPFILRDLSVEPFWSGSPRPAFDITSAYGYSGPFLWGPGDREAVAREFWAEYRDWACAHSIASEFVRFSLFDDNLLPYHGEKWKAADHVVRLLDMEESALWMDFEHKVRKNVNKAVRSGVSIEIDETGRRLPDFLDIYQHTMDRHNALEAYYFSRKYFEQLARNLPGGFVYFHALLDNTVISTELVLVSAHSVYSFLGGTRVDYFEHRPNDLLKFSVIKWARERHKSSFVLGGGYQPDDGIFRYKLAFAPHGQRSYYLGGRTFSNELAADLIRARERLASARGEAWSPRAGFFPAYRS